MIKKLTLATVATMALLFIPAQAEGNKCAAGKCGAGMMEKSKADNTGKTCKKCSKKAKGSGLLMHLPSPMRWIMKNENNPKLALTAEQKSKFEAQRKEMMPKMMKLKGDIKAVKKEIKDACKKNVTAKDQKANVEKLAILKAEATMMKLTCIESVKSTLSKEQWVTLKGLRKAKVCNIKSKDEK